MPSEDVEKVMRELKKEIGEEFLNKHLDIVLKSREMKILLETLSRGKSSEDLRRLKEFKALVKKCRMIGYYEERRFRGSKGEEISIEERGSDLEKITDRIASIFTHINGRTILDIGSGTFPIYLAKKLPAGTVYIAIDSRREVIDDLRRFTYQGINLIPVLCDASKADFRSILKDNGFLRADLALLLRVLRVLMRTRKIDPLEFIESIPASSILISEPTISLVKKREIRRRERNFLLTLARKIEERGIYANYELWSFGNEIFLFLK
ncbi:MAG: class I SAM-dependent methyltransferase [Fervidicoccaceae archaeon]